MAEECDLCERSISQVQFKDPDGHVFCSHGCEQVHLTLGSGNDVEETEVADQSAVAMDGQKQQHEGDISDERLVQSFLRVDGMHTVTCEAFLESIADSFDGVVESQASYVTETIRIDHDPEQTSITELCEALSTLGYTASPRAETTTTPGTDASRPGTSGMGVERGLDDMLGFRYVAGVVFGSFMLLPYVVLLYPAQLSSLLDSTGLLPSGSLMSGSGSLMALRLFLVLTGVVLFFTGLPLLRGAYVSLKMRRPNTDLLVTITVVSAYVYSTIAFLLGRIDVFYDMTIVITAIVVAAIFYETVAKQRAMDLLTDLTVSQIDEARLYHQDGTTTTAAVEDLDPGDRVLVRQGERIPVDGVLAEGACTVNEAVVTGESLPVPKQAGDDVIGGSLVTEDAAIVEVGKRATSSIDRLRTAVWDIQSADHGIQRRADKLASIIIPAVSAVAILAGVASFVLGARIPTAILAVLTVLIVGCPWALGLSTPLSVATSIEEAMKAGIVVFDETVFERLRDIDVVVFDKTGTLTTGEMDVIEADSPDELLAAAASLERRASHPAATAIVTAFSGGDGGDGPRTDGGVVDGQDEPAADQISDFRSHSNGVQGTVHGREILIGNLDLFMDQGWSVSNDLATRATEARGFGRLPVVVGRDGTAEGLIIVGDEPRDGWDQSITRLSERDIEIVVLTGDDEEATDFFGRHPHVDHVFADVPPEGKTATIQRLQTDRRVTMVGDGTNDAPALAQADLGISLGSGTALASDAADITIVGNDLESVETVFDLAHEAQRRLKQNTGLALLYNVVTIPLAVVGLLNPLFAMAAVIASGGLIAINSTRKLVNQ